MNNDELAYKLKYILHELGMNRTELLNACKTFNPSISKPTILNAINGKNVVAPTIETLSTIIKVCQTSNNEKLKNISYDFLLNDNIQEIEANTAQVYQEIGISDEVINKLKQYNHPLYYNYNNIINYYLYHLPANYFKYMEFLKFGCDIIHELKKEEYDIKKVIKFFDNDSYLEYLERNFKNIYDIYINIKNKKEIKDKSSLIDLIKILNSHFKYLLLDINKKIYDAM